MKDQKWFWLTFGTWCFITTVGAWALISSPFHLDSKVISEYPLQFNGTVEKNRISVCASELDQSVVAIRQEWQKEGWTCTTRNFDLFSLLMNPSPADRSLADKLARLLVFQNGANVRLLGLLRNYEDGQTYQWTAEMSQKAFEIKDPSQLDFPLKPPVNALNFFFIKSKKLECCTWSLPLSPDIENQFTTGYVSQGFSGRLWSRKSDESVYILKKGSTRLLGVIKRESQNNKISLVKFD